MGLSSPMQNGQLCLFLIFEMLGVTPLVFFNTTCSIYQFLFSGKKRMTGRTDLHLDFLLHGTNLDLIAAGTDSFHLTIFRVDTFFHNP